MRLLLVLAATALAAPAEYSFALRPGAELEPAAWSHQRELVVPRTTSGLYRVAIGPQDEGLLRPDHGDLRLVDAEDRPWAPLPGALAPNPEHDPRLQAVQERGPTVLLWAVLLLVGGGLAGVTLRLGGGRSATGPGGSDPQEPDQAGSAQQ